MVSSYERKDEINIEGMFPVIVLCHDFGQLLLQFDNDAGARYMMLRDVSCQTCSMEIGTKTIIRSIPQWHNIERTIKHLVHYRLIHFILTLKQWISTRHGI